MSTPVEISLSTPFTPDIDIPSRPLLSEFAELCDFEHDGYDEFDHDTREALEDELLEFFEESPEGRGLGHEIRHVPLVLTLAANFRHHSMLGNVSPLDFENQPRAQAA